MAKQVNFKNLNLLSPIIGVVSIFIVQFFPFLAAEIKVSGVVKNTYTYSIWDLIFAEKGKAYYTNTSRVFILLFIVAMLILLISNVSVYRKAEISCILPVIGFIIHCISFVAMLIMLFNAEYSMIKPDYQGSGVSADSSSRTFPLFLLIFEYVALALSFFSTINMINNNKSDAEIEQIYKKRFWVNIIIYLVPLIIVGIIILLLLIFGLHVPITGGVAPASSKTQAIKKAKTVTVKSKTYSVVGNKIFDGNSEVGKIIRIKNNEYNVIDNKVFDGDVEIGKFKDNKFYRTRR